MPDDNQTSKPQEKYFEDQLDGEEVLFVFRKHPVVMRKGLIIASIAMVIGPLFTLILAFLRPDSPPTMNFFYASLVLSLVVSVLIFMPHWISWHFSVFIVTDQRFIQITRRGLFKHKMGDLALDQIQTMNYEVNGFVETMLGFGTIVLQTYIGDLVIHPVPKPAKIQQKMATILRDQGTNPVDSPDQEN